MEKEKMKEHKWVVWVGAIANYFDYREDAQDFADSWIEQGYDDIIIERA
jgi:hypothetical protein